jgi:hypothetical protein
MLSFVAGVPGIAEGGAGLWGRWLTSQSLDKNVGPRPLIPAVSGPDTIPQLISQQSDATSISELHTSSSSHLSPLATSAQSNQCVFLRGFHVGDRKWFKRRKIRIDAENGLKIVPKLSTPKPSSSKKITNQDSGTSGGSSQSGTSHPSAQSNNIKNSGPQDEVGSDSDDGSLADIEEVGYVCANVIVILLTSRQRKTPAEAMIDYIFEVCLLPNCWSMT